MAINPETQYPGKIAPSTPDYPYGAARNITAPGDGTGTPWEAALVNDVFGFQQALLSAAAIIPTGTPDKVGASQYLDSLAKRAGVVHYDVSAIIADESLPVGAYVRTANGAEYLIAQNQVVDGVADHLLTNGNVALLQATVGVHAGHLGVVGDGITDDAAAIVAASKYAAGKGIPLSFAGLTCLIGSTMALTTDHIGLTWDLAGGTLRKGFNGSLVTVTGTEGFDITGDGVIDGNNTSYTGKGIIYSGSCNYPTIAKTVTLLNFDDAAIEFGADAGFRAKINPVIRFDSGSHVAISCTGPDAGAVFRDFSGVSTNGSISLVGADDTSINNAFVTRVDIDPTCNITLINGTVWGNSGGPVTIDGALTVITGCRISAAVTLASTLTGVFSGNVQSSPGFTDNSITGNVIIHHHEPAAEYNILNRHKVNAFPLGEIQVNNYTTIADADYSWSTTVSGTILRYAATLTADRTITLPTTGVRIFSKVKIYRGIGEFNLIIGATGKVLSANEWCEIMYTGLAWEVIAAGSR